ncbi:MAG: hypothetical protein DLM72_02590 [Candidatus Nitrosopolaris wilkensis]|nr:MAG: hypothetical protein DLM72_02590 [Candidatus Nitrosopolaris wilkensis]
MKKNILYKNESDASANSNKHLRIIYTISEEARDHEQEQISSGNQWDGERGRIDKAMLTKYLGDEDMKNSIFYTCGPPSMLKAMQKLLQDDLQIPKERIKIEEFTGY